MTIRAKLYARYNINKDGSPKDEPHYHLLNSLVSNKEKSYELILSIENKDIRIVIDNEEFCFLDSNNAYIFDEEGKLKTILSL